MILYLKYQKEILVKPWMNNMLYQIKKLKSPQKSNKY
jgi:hypothetical protein